jgi:aspartate/methionine/tyrosine aminotransferase
MRLLAAAAARRASGAVVHDLTTGQPSTPAPVAVRAAAARALDSDLIGYTMSTGIPTLRSAIAAHYERTYGLTVDPGEVVVTTGSSGGFILTFLAAFAAGDRVVVTRPGYPAYRNTLAALGCDVLELPADASSRFQPTLAQLQQLDRPPAGLIVASPANPTGTMLPADELAAIAGWCARNGVRLISDEIYHGITYSLDPTCAWQTDRSAVVVNSFSKYWAMTGWRLGWLLCPADLVDAVDRLASNLALCPPTLAQHAAVRAFDDYTELDERVAGYRRNRALLLPGLRELGLTRLAPADGAFYAYVDVSEFCADSMAFCYRMLDEIGVAVAPGVDFDPVGGHRFIRMSFAGDESGISGALSALGDWLPSQRQ